LFERYVWKFSCGEKLSSEIFLKKQNQGLSIVDAPSSARQREREWLFKSHCTSWSLLSVENVAEKAQSRLDEILIEAAYIQIEYFGGTHN
jgi:hypothetical protein